MKIRQAITWSVLIGVVAAGTLLWLWNRHRNAESRILARGVIAIQQGDVNQAAEAFRDAHRRYPESYAPAYWLARAELQLGRTDEARRMAQAAAKLDPKKAEPYVLQATTFRADAGKKYDGLVRVASESEFLAAEGLCGQALKILEPAAQIAGKENADVLAERGFCYSLLSRLHDLHARSLQTEASHVANADPAKAADIRKDAEKYAKEKAEAADRAFAAFLASLRQKKENARVAEAAQDLAASIGRHDVVLEAYDVLASANAVSERAATQAAQSLVGRALTPVSTEDWKASQRAIDILESYIKAHPDAKCLDARVVLARALLARGERNAAGKVVDRILELDSTNQWGRLMKGQLLLAAGRPDEAKTILQPLGTQMREFVPYKLTMAEAQRLTGYPQVERQLYREVLDLDPGNADAHLALIRDLLAEGQTGSAEGQLAAAIEAAPQNERLLRFAVDYWLDRGKDVTARELLDRTAGRADLPRATTELLAELYARVGQIDRAEELIRQAGPGDAGTPSVRQQFVLASLAIARGRTSEGRRMFEELAAANPNWAQGHLGLARALMMENRGEDAAKEAHRALEIDARDPSVQLAAAGIFASTGMLEEAQSLCDKILLGEPNNQAALTLAARIDLIRQDYDSASKRLETLNTLAGLNLKDWLIQAEFAYRQGQFQKCVEICKDKNELMALWLTAKSFSQMGKHEDAAKELIRLIELQPSFGQAYDELVRTWLTIDTPDGAMQRLSSIKNAPPLPLATSKGAILAAMGKFDDAIAIYNALLADNAISSNPRAVRLMRTALATCYRRKNDSANELKQYEAVADEKETHIDGEFMKYQFYRRANRTEQAVAVLDRVSREAGDDESSLLLRQRLASAYAEIGQADKALAELNRAIAVRPDLVQLVRQKIDLYWAARKLDEAQNTVNEALNRWPDDIRLIETLADIQAARRDYPAALATLDRMSKAGESADLEARYDRAVLLVHLGLYSEAIETLRGLLGDLSTSQQRHALVVAQGLIGLGQHEEAQARLAAVPASSPTYRSAQLLLAADLQRTGKLDEAIKVLRGLVDARIDDAEAAYRLCDALTVAGRFDDASKVAEDQLQRFAPRTPQAVNWRLILASLAGRQHNWSEAINRYQDVCNMLPNRSDLRWHLALHQLAADRAKAAAALLAKDPPELLLRIVARSLAGNAASQPAASTQPTAAEQLIQSATTSENARLACILTVLASQEDPQKVLKALEGVNTPLAELVKVYLASPSARQDKSRQVCALLAQAMIAQAYGLSPLADHFCEQANKLDANSPFIPSVWLPVLVQLGKREEAAKVGEAARAQLGKTRWALETAIWEAMAANDDETVIKKVNEAEAAGPVSTPLLTFAGASLMRQGRLAEALKRFEQALAAEPDNPDANNNVAYLLAEAHPDDPAALDRAAKLADKALSLSPNNASILETRGWIRVKRGDAKGGLPDLVAGIEAHRDDPRVHYHLGVCYSRLGQNGLARLHLANVARLGGPDLPEARLADELLKKLPSATQPAATSAPIAAAK